MTSSPGQDDAELILTLYMRHGCHLCEDMHTALLENIQNKALSIKTVDIDLDDELKARFNDYVPVLMHQNTEICHYYLDLQALSRYLAQHDYQI